MYLTDFVNFFFFFNKTWFWKIHAYILPRTCPLMFNLVAFRGNLICILRLCSTQQIVALLAKCWMALQPLGLFRFLDFYSPHCLASQSLVDHKYCTFKTQSSHVKIKSHCKQWVISIFIRVGALFLSLHAILSGLFLLCVYCEVCWGRSEYDGWGIGLSTENYHWLTQDTTMLFLCGDDSDLLNALGQGLERARMSWLPPPPPKLSK